MNLIYSFTVLLLVLAFQATLISTQSLPQCVIDAFPDLNITEVAQYRPDEKSGGLVCDLCTTLFTEIQHILLDGEIEDAVSNNPHYVILWKIRTCFKTSLVSDRPCGGKPLHSHHLGFRTLLENRRILLARHDPSLCGLCRAARRILLLVVPMPGSTHYSRH